MKRLLSAALVLLATGCSQAETLREGPALSDEALSGLNISRAADEVQGIKNFITCLDEYSLQFDDDNSVADIFSDIAKDSDAEINNKHVEYFTSQKKPERFKRFIDAVTVIDEKTNAQVFHYSYAEHCKDGNTSDCTLGTDDEELLVLYMSVILHGSNMCEEVQF